MVGTIIIIVLLVNNSSTDVLIVGTYPLLKDDNIVSMANCTTHVSKVDALLWFYMLIEWLN